jgi:CDP-diacylglycerol pyrophosphatase
MKIRATVVLSAGLLTTVSAACAQTAEKVDTAKQGAACVVPHDSSALLKLMHCCTRDLSSSNGCKEYDPVNQYVIIKDDDAEKPQAYLLIPSVKVTGIEDKQIFRAPYVNLWANAWDQSQRYPGWESRRIGMAINSVHARTQNQLHVHISCIDAQVAETLDDKVKGDGPYTLSLGSKKNSYTVTMRNDLTDKESPFWVAREMERGEAMANKSVAVVKSKEAGRYFILTTVYKDGKGGNAEELLDQRCGSAP